MTEITPVQLAVHQYIQKRLLEDWPPTTREICAHMKWSATNSAVTVLVALEKKGYIRTGHSKPRAIKVLIWTGPRCGCCSAPLPTVPR